MERRRTSIGDAPASDNEVGIACKLYGNAPVAAPAFASFTAKGALLLLLV